MFGVILGSTNFLIRLDFKREIDNYVETLHAQVSNKYRAFVETVEKKVHAAATDVKLHRAIERRSDYVYLPATEFDLLAYGTPDGKLLYPDFGARKDARTYNPLENQEGHIRLRSIPQQSDIGLQFVVQATQVGEWGFVTGGDRLQTWLEAQTNIQSDEHPIFLVGKPQIPHSAAISSEPKMDVENWVPLNNASRETRRDGWSEAFVKSQSAREVFLQETPENGGSTYTAFRITPFNSPFAIAREATPVDLIVAYSHKRQMAWQQQLTLTLLLSGLGGLVLVYLISYIISRLVTRPVEMLQEGVSHIAAGDLDHRVKIQSLNEIGQLAEGFNHMAQELKRSLEERMAVERAATWRDVARQVAHEIKNPLFPIRLSVENLQQAKSNPEVFEQIFDQCTATVIEEVDRIGKLIDEFHQFARMPKLQKKPSQLNSIVRAALNLYTGGQIPNLEHHAETSADIMPKDTELQNPMDKFWLENVSKIKVETELAPLPQLLLDPEQIAQALGNLFKNAIEAMPDGGTLMVKTYFTPNGSQQSAIRGMSYGIHTQRSPDREPHTVDFDSDQQRKSMAEGNTQLPDAKSREPKAIKGTVSLEIQDTGCGMSEETMANIFVPYYTTKVEADGTGLGIPIVKRIVTEHSAEMDCQSAENIGTTVRIHFPYSLKAPSEPAAEKSEELTPETKEQTIARQT